jgi:hypothetical protein
MKIVIIGIIKVYKKFISPLFPQSCRFYPTCSEYAILSIDKHGIIKGIWYAFIRIMKCHPYNPGGYDPVK